ncbi:hypothetical protein AABB24_002785 [Solanum stoloniferum]|uniref:Uncharacterized protein n=1 Tax=Solanum stoloniferum TaxID=62892 RepID=A0ABD2V4M0_9SOLN
MMMRHGKIMENFDLRMNRTHLLYLSIPKSLPEKTEYKTPLRKSNFWASARQPSVLAAPPLYQQANGTTFVPLRKSNLKVNNSRTDMPESLNHSPVHLVFLAHPPSVSATPPPYQQENGTTFVPLSKSNLKVNNGGTDMPDL